MAADTAVVVGSYLNDNNKTDKHIFTLLKCVKENQCLLEYECSKDWTAKANSFLNSKTERWLGISLLATIIPQCDTETFTINCITWIKAIVQVIQSSSASSSLIQCSVRVMDDLMKYAIQFPDISRTIANSVMPSLISALLSRKDKDVDSILSGICTCVRYMPGPVAPFKVQIESYIIPCLDSWNTKIRKNTCQCFALLAGCSSNTTSTDKYKTNWECQWNRVLATINHALNNLYANVEMSNNPLNDTLLGKTETLAVSDITDAEPERTNVLTARLISLLDCLNIMTREGTHRISMIPIEDTLLLVERIVAVNGNMLKSVSVDVVLLKTCLSVIHESAIRLLNSLLQRCRSLLLPNNHQISNVLIRELSWTLNDKSQDKRHDGHKPYSNLRCILFKCFINWCHLKASISTDIIKKVILNILTDIRPQTKQTKLMNPDDHKQPKSSNKAKKRKLQEMEQLSTSQKKENPIHNLCVCHAALSALYAILMNGVANLTKDLYQEIQGVLLNLILQCQVSVPGRMPSPYSDADCRKSLYQCLLACVVACPPQAPSSIQCAIRCCTRGLQDMHPKVSSYCREALTILTAIIHPLVPSLESATQFVMLPTNSKTCVVQDNDKHQETNALSAETSVVNQNGSEVPAHDGSRLLEGTVLDVPVGVCESMQASSNTYTKTQPRENEELQINTDFNTDIQQINIFRSTLSNQDPMDTRESINTQAIECTKHSDLYSSSKHQSKSDVLTKDNVDIAASGASKSDVFESDLQEDTNISLPLTDTLDAESIEMSPAKMQKLGAGKHIVVRKDEERHEGKTSIGNAKTDEDMGDVDEMLATFVNTSPDSDSD
ncbi:proline-, glutamic acid- and leucine-rich protein 1-like [Actinia tenebrosa]|uniref:Proline-, glutamic acid- and leucine-rich protein 1-like n=1 Tax=Actinia tenebrosa TaxID=6105 RepID=A0A6P8HB07_ACTTE|nr:proline-, glutamic acid- and leucine-rich protein 1-like [Actinia tenebrosa]